MTNNGKCVLLTLSEAEVCHQIKITKMFDLKIESEKILLLGKKSPTPEAQKMIHIALESKWEGLQAVAMKTLGSWGDNESINKLRELLDKSYKKKFEWAIRGVIISALIKCFRKEDISWILDKYFSLYGTLAKHELLPLILRLPVKEIRNTLLLQCHSNDCYNRQAAMKAIGNMDFPEKESILASFLNDEYSEIREGARLLLGGLNKNKLK